MIPLRGFELCLGESISAFRELDISSACSWVTAEVVASKELVPPFDNTAVDGYAVKAADTDGATETTEVTRGSWFDTCRGAA